MRISVSSYSLLTSIPTYHTWLTRRTTDDLTSVAPALEHELRKLEQMFTVDAAKLKEISMHFERELRQGLSRVSRCLLPSSVSPCLQSNTFNMCAC
jgi:hexokinase